MPTLIYGFWQPKFEFGVANLGLGSWVMVGKPSCTDLANPSSSFWWPTWVWKLVLGWLTLIYGLYQPNFEFGMANLGSETWVGWQTLIYGFWNPKFESRVANLGLETWVGGSPSYTDVANSSSSFGWRACVWKLVFGVANPHIGISPTQVRVWHGELGFGNLGLRL